MKSELFDKKKEDISCIDNIESKIRELSENDRILLFERFGVPKQNAPSILAVVIHDWEGRDLLRPKASIYYSNESTITIDILETIKKNALSISHPAVLVAIRRWEQIIRHFRVLYRYFYDESLKPEADFYEIARNHLRRVGAAIYEGAKERTLSSEKAFGIYAQPIDERDERYNYLRTTWEILARDEIKRIRNLNVKLKAVSDIILNMCGGQWNCYAAWVFQFFESEEGKMLLRKRRSWRATLNAYDGWLFKLDRNTVRTYRSSANKPSLDEYFNDGFALYPGSNNVYDLSEIGVSSLLPVVLIPSK